MRIEQCSTVGTGSGTEEYMKACSNTIIYIGGKEVKRSDFESVLLYVVMKNIRKKTKI